jgi:small nuclear ribonucleoprotein B and B'
MVLGRVPKNTRLETLLNYKVRVTTSNTSTFVGTLMSYDKYMNLVLSECEEFRLQQKSKKYLDQVKNGEIDESKIKEQKRLLGLTILRGENIISVVAESAPNINTLKPQLRLKKGKIAIKPLMKKVSNDNSDSKTNSGIKKPAIKK